MRVTIEQASVPNLGTIYRLKILDGYRAGSYVRSTPTGMPVFDVDRDRLHQLATETGYNVTVADPVDTEEDLHVFRTSQSASPAGAMMRSILGL